MDLAKVYEEYADFIYKYLYRLSLDKAVSEELTQETFYQAVKSIDNFRGECKLSTWLCQIAKHCWLKHLKSKSKDVSLDNMQESITDSNNPEIKYFETIGMVSIYKQILKLKNPYREVVLLRVMGNLSFSEIASIMEKTEGWARVTFHRAKYELLERMENNEG